jgi:hypothetical protein
MFHEDLTRHSNVAGNGRRRRTVGPDLPNCRGETRARITLCAEGQTFTLDPGTSELARSEDTATDTRQCHIGGPSCEVDSTVSRFNACGLQKLLPSAREG